ncbi:MAG: succinate dehydrogenase assembly factor 2, partial [Gammaproteobacteria bacterium]|nr:succinate dehydrogenase assembly factor 2 [Gammaproteobacteria bacterium]
MQQLDKQKIFWHSRRGMLELDLLLVPFANDVFSDLNT